MIPLLLLALGTGTVLALGAKRPLPSAPKTPPAIPVPEPKGCPPELAVQAGEALVRADFDLASPLGITSLVPVRRQDPAELEQIADALQACDTDPNLEVSGMLRAKAQQLRARNAATPSFPSIPSIPNVPPPVVPSGPSTLPTNPTDLADLARQMMLGALLDPNTADPERMIQVADALDAAGIPGGAELRQKAQEVRVQRGGGVTPP